MSATEHHGADDDFAKRGELSAEGARDCRVAETEADVAAGWRLEIVANRWGLGAYYADMTSKKMGNSEKLCHEG